MATINVKPESLRTHEGGKAKYINFEMQLRRSIMSCLLWEDTFYENGELIANRIGNLVSKVNAKKVMEMAIEAREKMKLRHIPLLLVREMARLSTHKYLVSKTLERVIQRPDELTEFLAIYWKDGRQPLSAQVKKGLAKAFTKFNEYQLQKYNRDNKIKLRDVLFLSHAKPLNEEQDLLWKKLIDDKLEIPDTWETNLSAGKDKKETWTRLLKEKRLGGLALLRNLRNMKDVNVNIDLIKEAILGMNTERILPFRFITASKYLPAVEQELEIVMLKCLKEQEKLVGKTILLIDVSGSMIDEISKKSEVLRIDVGIGLAILLRELCEDVRIFTFSNDCVEIAPRRGFALRDVIYKSQSHGSTLLGNAIRTIKNYDYDRIIIITDEQTADSVSDPKGKGYIINIASYKNGVGYGKWLHIDGWSEAVIDYIREYEKLFLENNNE